MPLKLTSMNFEMMSGLSAPLSAAGPPASSMSLPHSAGALNNGAHPANDWHPMNAPHDDFFLPSNKQRDRHDDVPPRNTRRSSSRNNYDYHHGRP